MRYVLEAQKFMEGLGAFHKLGFLQCYSYPARSRIHSASLVMAQAAQFESYVYMTYDMVRQSAVAQRKITRCPYPSQ